MNRRRVQTKNKAFVGLPSLHQFLFSIRPLPKDLLERSLAAVLDSLLGSVEVERCVLVPNSATWLPDFPHAADSLVSRQSPAT